MVENNATLTGFSNTPNIAGMLDDFEKLNTPVQEGAIQTAPVQAAPVDARQALSSTLDEFEKLPKDVPTTGTESLQFAEGIVSSTDAKNKAQAMDLSKKLGVPADVIQAQLLESTPNQLIAKYRGEMVSSLYPRLAKWAADPENYPLFGDAPDYIQGVNKSFEALNPDKMDDVQKAITKSVVSYRRAAIDTAMLLGMMDLEQGKKLLRQADDVEDRLSYVQALPGLRKMQEESKDLIKPTEDFLRGLKGVYDSATEGKFNDTIKALKASGKSAGEIFAELYDVAKSLYDDPDAAKVFTVEALMSSAPSIVGGVAGGALGGKLGPVGAVAGSFLGAAATSFPLEFSGKLREQLEEYRNPVTGKIDYDAAFGDPERLAQWRRDASVFAGTIAASEGVYANVIGKPFTKIISKTPGGKIPKAIVGSAAEVATGAIEEAASNITATVAMQAVRGDLSAESLAKAAPDIAADFIGGGIAGGVMGTAIGASRYMLDTTKEKFSKTKNVVEQTNKASMDAASLSNARAKISENEMFKQNKEQMRQLVQESMRPRDELSDPSINEDADKVTSPELIAREKIESAGQVEVTPSEMQTFFSEQGINVEEVFKSLPEEKFQQYLKNRATDTAVSIDIVDWISITENYPEIDILARINGNEITGAEAAIIQNELESEPFTLFQRGDDEIAPPPLPGQEEIAPPPLPAEKELPTAITRVEEPTEMFDISEIASKFRNVDEQAAFEKIKEKIQRSTKKAKAITKPMADIAAEIHFRVAANRAQVLGKSITEIADQLQISDETSILEREGALAAMAFSQYQEGGILLVGTWAKANAVIHELGHLWLNDMSIDYDFMSKLDFNNMNDYQKAYWDAMNIAADALGLNNIGELNSLSREDRTRVHETFAQTTEKYFLEGSAVGKKFRALMEAFRKFLMPIAEIVGKAYKQYPALEITPQIERMFESIMAPKNKADEVMLPLFPEPTIPMEILGAKSQEYYAKWRAALTESIAQYMQKITSMSYAERENLIDSILNEAYDQAQQQVDALPEMILRNEIENSYQEYKTLKKQNRPVPEPRISYNSFVEIMGSEELADSMIGNLRTTVAGKKKGGIDISAIMYANKISDPLEMRRMLISMSMRDSMIERQANQIAKDNMPILKTDDEIMQEASESLAEANLTPIFRAELKIMMEDYMTDAMRTAEMLQKSPETWIREDVTDEASTKNISNALVANFKKTTYRADFRKFSRDSAKAFRMGDIFKAFENKVKSIIAYKSFLKAVEVEKMLEKERKRVKQFKKYSRNLDYRNTFDSVIMDYGLQVITALERGQRTLPTLFTPDPAEPSRIEIPQESGVTVDQVYSINQYIFQLQRMLDGASPQNMTVGAALQIGKLIKMIQFVARKSRQVVLEGRAADIQDIRTQVSMDISGSSSAVRSYDIKKRGYPAMFLAAKDQVQTIFGTLYQSNVDYVKSSIGKMMAIIDERQALRNLNYTKDKNEIVKSVRTALEATRDKSMLERYMMPLLRKTAGISSRVEVLTKESKPIEAPDLGMTFDNIAEYWMAELMMGSESGAEKFLRGGTEKSPGAMAEFDFETGRIDRTGFERTRQRLIEQGLLTKEHFDMLQVIWDKFRTIHPQLRAEILKTDGYDIGEVQGVSFEAFGQTYTGGYVPVARIAEVNLVNKLDQIMDGNAGNMNVQDMYPIMNTGMLNERSKQFYPVDLNFNRVMNYLSAAYDIIYLRDPLMTFAKVMKGPEVRAAMEAKRPGAFENVIIPWAEKVKSQQRTTPSKELMDRAALRLRRNLNISLYLGNLITPIIQYTGLTPVIIQNGATNMAMAAAEYHTDPKKWSQFINDSSAQMRNRFDKNIQRHLDIHQDLMSNVDWISKFDEGVEKVAFFGIQTAQNHVDKITWISSYLKMKRQGSEESDAINYANFMVNSTQASSDVSWLNQWQTTTAAKKLLTGIATSYVFSINNVVTREVARNPNKMKQAQAMVLLGFLYYGTMAAVDKTIRETIKSFGDDDEKEEMDDGDKLALMTAQIAAGVFGLSVPIIGGIPESMIYSGSADFAPATTRISRDATGAIKGAFSIGRDVPLTPREMKSILNTITMFTGIPTSVLAKDFFIEEVLIENIFEETIEDRSKDRRGRLRDLK